jgi:hypothetical protein
MELTVNDEIIIVKRKVLESNYWKVELNKKSLTSNKSKNYSSFHLNFKVIGRRLPGFFMFIQVQRYGKV